MKWSSQEHLCQRNRDVIALKLLEDARNPRGGGAWWAAVYGVAQSRTGLK